MLEAMPDGSICAVMKDWPSFLLFKSEFQAFSNADFSTHHTQLSDSGKTVNKRFYCRSALPHLLHASQISPLTELTEIFQFTLLTGALVGFLGTERSLLNEVSVSQV